MKRKYFFLVCLAAFIAMMAWLIHASWPTSQNFSQIATVIVTVICTIGAAVLLGVLLWPAIRFTASYHPPTRQLATTKNTVQQVENDYALNAVQSDVEQGLNELTERSTMNAEQIEQAHLNRASEKVEEEVARVGDYKRRNPDASVRDIATIFHLSTGTAHARISEAKNRGYWRE